MYVLHTGLIIPRIIHFTQISAPQYPLINSDKLPDTEINESMKALRCFSQIKLAMSDFCLLQISHSTLPLHRTPGDPGVPYYTMYYIT